MSKLVAKIYLDEDISPVLAYILRKQGVDAISARDIGMIQKKDVEHLYYSKQAGRVLVTFNAVDFIKAIKVIPDHSGVILSRQMPIDLYSALADAIIDKLTLVPDWNSIIVWTKLG